MSTIKKGNPSMEHYSASINIMMKWKFMDFCMVHCGHDVGFADKVDDDDFPRLMMYDIHFIES